MNTHHQTPGFSAVVEQLTNNTTSWLGHRKGDHKEIVTGQTFLATTEGDLDTIEVFSAVVANPGDVVMTLHAFDPFHQSWGAALGSATVSFNRSLNNTWVAFKIPGLHLAKGLSYGFRMHSHDSFIGVGEAVGSAKSPPYAEGREWKFSGDQNKSDAHSFGYFSLAFKVGLKAA